MRETGWHMASDAMGHIAHSLVIQAVGKAFMSPRSMSDLRIS